MSNWDQEKDLLGKEIITELYNNHMILTWYRDNPKGWILHSGNWSPFYIQLRELSAFPYLLKKVGSGLARLIHEEIPKTDMVIGLAMAGIPIATAITVEGQIPSAFTRKVEGQVENYEELIQKYGQHSLIEGRLEDGQNVILIDDLVSYFTSKLQGIHICSYEAKKRNIHLNVKDILVLLDREQGGSDEAKRHNVNLHALIPFKSRGIDWLKDSLAPIEYQVLSEYLEDPEKYQDPALQEKLKNESLNK